jgi:hypothetical protein
MIGYFSGCFVSGSAAMRKRSGSGRLRIASAIELPAGSANVPRRKAWQLRRPSWKS